VFLHGPNMPLDLQDILIVGDSVESELEAHGVMARGFEFTIHEEYGDNNMAESGHE
jgi:hypothetical protein